MLPKYRYVASSFRTNGIALWAVDPCTDFQLLVRIFQSSILFLVVFFVIAHSVPIHSLLNGQSIQCHVDMGEILSIRKFLFPFIHCFI